MLFRTFVLKIAGLKPFENLVTKSFLFKPLVRRFVAGDNLEAALKVGEEYAEQGFLVSMDLLGENVRSREAADRGAATYIEMVKRIAESPNRERMNISVKLTALGLDLGDGLAEENYRKVLVASQPHDIFVRADMEASEYTAQTVKIIDNLYGEFKNCGTVLQSYLLRPTGDVKHMIEMGATVRIVKGAYLEPDTVAFQQKPKVDEMYIKAAKTLLKDGNYPAIATHDLRIVQELKGFIESERIPYERFEWQMIYGVRRDLQRQLLGEGFNVRIYIPYGPDWYPYFSRRLAERPANLFFILKSLFQK
ncbi:MAG: proline dehydrogenase family protein [Armatimonadetes bacterium]|nr:proline dehydrogenase family protein [Armatimonadota bacterium]